MGVGGVRARLKNESKNLIKKVNNGERECFDAVAVEVNPILHEAAGCADDCEGIFEYTKNFLNNLLSDVVVDGTQLLLVIDGQPPLAKLAIQRERRLRYNEEELSFNRLNFTPGTQFMSKLKRFLKKWVSEFSERHQLSSHVLSADDSAGEGELKITRWLQSIKASKICIVGTDGDLILSMLSQPLLNCCVFDPIAKTVVSTGSVLREWSLPYYSAIDYSSLQLLLGSDIVPGVVNYDCVNTWNAYKKKGKQLWFPDYDKRILILNYPLLSSILKCFSGKKRSSSGNKGAKGWIESWAWSLQMMVFGECNFCYIPKSTVDVKSLLQYCKGKVLEEVMIQIDVDGQRPCLQATLAAVIPSQSWKSYLQPAVYSSLKGIDVDDTDCYSIDNNIMSSLRRVPLPYEPFISDHRSFVDPVCFTSLLGIGCKWELYLSEPSQSSNYESSASKNPASDYYKIIVISSLVIIVAAATTTVLVDNLSCLAYQ